MRSVVRETHLVEDGLERLRLKARRPTRRRLDECMWKRLASSGDSRGGIQGRLDDQSGLGG